MEPTARRRSLRRLAGGALAVAAAGAAWTGLRPQLINPCRSALPPDIAGHRIVADAWEGVDPAHFLDCHVHIAGTGDSGSGIALSPEMDSLMHPLQFAQRLFYLNAGCAHDAPGQVDRSFVERLHNLVDGLRPGARLLLFAFDRAHDEKGRAMPERSAFYVPNDYVRDLARQSPHAFEWACSIHPHRPDAVAALEAAAAAGARAVKWLPAAMGIDPGSAACDAFYAALARLDLPLITHAGEERAVHGAGAAAAGNPLKLRRPLDAGVRVVVAHCASIGEDIDLDRGEAAPALASFELFARLMGERRYERHLFADISAVTMRNRSLAVLRTIVERSDWHPRLLNGSDYPLPGVMPLFSPTELADGGLLDAAAVPVLNAIQGANPLLFDFVLKRQLRSGGKRLAAGVFQTRDFFRAGQAR
jgi:predicted TIM-barrel fold metal-dependent hydrolase